MSNSERRDQDNQPVLRRIFDRRRIEALALALLAGLAPLVFFTGTVSALAAGLYTAALVLVLAETARGLPEHIATFEADRAQSATRLVDLAMRQDNLVDRHRKLADSVEISAAAARDALAKLGDEVDRLSRVADREDARPADLEVCSTTDEALRRLETGPPGYRFAASIVRDQTRRTLTAVQDRRVSVDVAHLDDDLLFKVFGEETETPSFFWATILPKNVKWFREPRGSQYQSAMDDAWSNYGVKFRRLLVYDTEDQLDDWLIALFMRLHAHEPYEAKMIERGVLEEGRWWPKYPGEGRRPDVGIYAHHYVWETTDTSTQGELLRGDLVIDSDTISAYNRAFKLLWTTFARPYPPSHYDKHGCADLGDHLLSEFAELAAARADSEGE